MQRIERLHAISERLRRAAPATVTAGALADELGVTRRTIERDLATLRLAGVPLYGQAGRSGGVGHVRTTGRAFVALDRAQVVGLIVASDLARSAPFGAAASTAIGPLVESLDLEGRVAVERLRQRFRIAPAFAHRRQARICSVLEDAIATRTAVRLAYVDRHGERTSRIVEPAGFYGADATWSLVAWCQLRDAARLFRFERIERAVATKRQVPDHDVDTLLGWVPEPGRAP
jgi:predicted DNA-binding transcriptional regulator YafY